MLFEGYIDLRLSEEQIEAGIQQSGYAAFQTKVGLWLYSYKQSNLTQASNVIKKELTKYLNLEYWDSLHMRIRTVRLFVG